MHTTIGRSSDLVPGSRCGGSAVSRVAWGPVQGVAGGDPSGWGVPTHWGKSASPLGEECLPTGGGVDPGIQWWPQPDYPASTGVPHERQWHRWGDVVVVRHPPAAFVGL